MPEHEEHEWIPPRDNETIFGFSTAREDKTLPPQDKPKLKATEPTPAAKRFAEFATGVIMYSVFALAVALTISVGIRMIRWVAGV